MKGRTEFYSLDLNQKKIKKLEARSFNPMGFFYGIKVAIKEEKSEGIVDYPLKV